MPDLLHSALTRHALSALPVSPTASPPALRHLTLHDDSDDELISVLTPHPSSPSTPVASRSPSPTRLSSTTSSSSGTLIPVRTRSGAGKPRRDKTAEKAKSDRLQVGAKANPLDWLERFPGEVTGRILGALGVAELLAVGRVCKRWRRSMTLNYTWYLLLQSHTYESGPSSSLPVWRRADSKIDWAQRYASINRRDDLEQVNSDEDDEGITMKEERERRWEEEGEGERLGKKEMREWYKSLGNSKVKGKSGKGSPRTWEGDGLEGGGASF